MINALPFRLLAARTLAADRIRAARLVFGESHSAEGVSVTRSRRGLFGLIRPRAYAGLATFLASALLFGAAMPILANHSRCHEEPDDVFVPVMVGTEEVVYVGADVGINGTGPWTCAGGSTLQPFELAAGATTQDPSGAQTAMAGLCLSGCEFVGVTTQGPSGQPALVECQILTTSWACGTMRLATGDPAQEGPGLVARQENCTKTNSNPTWVCSTGVAGDTGVNAGQPATAGQVCAQPNQCQAGGGSHTGLTMYVNGNPVFLSPADVHFNGTANQTPISTQNGAGPCFGSICSPVARIDTGLTAKVQAAPTTLNEAQRVCITTSGAAIPCPAPTP